MDPQNPGLKIALAFSGGGYRAACFCLGMLSYLDKQRINGKSLLEHAVVLSTVSGGTITGAAYAIGIKQGQKFPSIYKSIYRFIKETDLVELSLERLITDEGWSDERIKSLINAFADIYDKELFDRARFGTLMKDEVPIHLKHLSFNATEFSNALQFRFQWSEKIKNPGSKEPPRGIIGNYYYRIPEEAAAEIRMGDILAASSCFPGGFEPINFPTDFVNSGSSILASLSKIEGYPVGLMDGGIVDNQGIEPILLAESRLKRNRSNNSKTDNELDLIIISDVASPFMEDYKASIQRAAKGWRNLTPGQVLLLNTVLLLLSGFGIYWFNAQGNVLMTVLSAVVATLALVVYIVGKFLKSLPKSFGVPTFFLKPLGKLLRLKLQVYETMIVNRKNSVMKMVGEVFLKHVRQLNYRMIYNDASWKNRRVMNAIYELSAGAKALHKKIQDEKLPGYLMPSPKLQEVATLAASMGTTLWFTSDELVKKNMLDSLIACGQFTLCWNLLEYIAKAKQDRTNLTIDHEPLLALEEVMKKEWQLFNEDPFWRVKELNKNLQEVPIRE